MVCEWCCGTSDANKISTEYELVSPPAREDHPHVLVRQPPRKQSSPVLPLAGQRYGYDFDGVLHTSVGKPDKDNHRHPTWFVEPELLVPFPEIIQQIKVQFEQGAEIFIITAQYGPTFRKYGYKFLKRPDVDLDRYIPADNRIADKCGSGKADEIKRLRLNKFYDDSGKNIDAIAKKIQDGSLPGVELYQVYPENSGTLRVVVKDMTPPAA